MPKCFEAISDFPINYWSTKNMKAKSYASVRDDAFNSFYWHTELGGSPVHINPERLVKDGGRFKLVSKKGTIPNIDSTSWILTYNGVSYRIEGYEGDDKLPIVGCVGEDFYENKVEKN